MDRLSDDLFIKEVPLEFIVENNPSLVTSYKLGNYSEYFYKKFKRTDFIDLLRKIKYKDMVSADENNFLGKVMITKNYLLKK